MSYDNEGHLTSWTAPSGTTGSQQNLYDAEGNRVLQTQTTSSGTSTIITFDGWTDTTISNGTTTTTKYYQAGGQTVAEATGTAWYTLVPDLLGSAVLALRSVGSVQAMQLYAPYGASRYSVGTMPTAYNFTGQRLDAVTGLLYYNARYYDPVSGRFTSADPVLNNTSGMDPYAYVGDNPTSATDPTGLMLIEGGDGGGGFGDGGDGGDGGFGDGGFGGGGGGGGGGLVDVNTPTGTEVLGPGEVPDISGSQGNVTAQYDPNDGTIMTVTTNADGSTTYTSLNPGDSGYEQAMAIASGMSSFPDETSDAEANPQSWGLDSGSTATPPSEPATEPSTGSSEPVTPQSSPNTVTYSRVQGGTPPNASYPRIQANEDGSISISNKSANLNVSVGDEHAAYFQGLRGDGSEVVQFDLPEWFDNFVEESAIRQEGYRSNPLNQGRTAPKIVDPTTPGRSYEFPPPWIRWIEEYGTNGRVVK
jgi:RHS repeat-associated protein